MAKGWVTANYGETILTSYNVTSITDAGVGKLTVTWSTDFSSADYAIAVSIQAATGGGVGTYPNVSNANVPEAGVTYLVSSSGQDGVLRDAVQWNVVVFGDQ